MGVMTKVGRGVPEIANRGYQVLFRPNESNRCPGCGRAQWVVGRVTAECFFCGTALPLADAKWAGGGGLSHRYPDAHVAIGAADQSDRRQDERRPGEGRSVRLLVDGLPQAFAVHNISSSGAMIEAPDMLLSGATVELVAPSGEIVPAEVRWSADGAHGLRFGKPIPEDPSVSSDTD